MITPEEDEYVLTRAYVPEHIVSLMVLVSKGEPFLMEDHLVYGKDNWLILVGYPLDGNFSPQRVERILNQAIDRFRPEYLWFIGPEIPPSLLGVCQERETDQYYRIDLNQKNPKPSLQRMADKASKELSVEREHLISKEHETLIAEFLKKEKVPSRVRELYLAMPDYVAHSTSSFVLNARDRRRRLSAFFVVELAAKQFATYLLGSYSKTHYVPHASDLLFLEMINLTREHGKDIINLGLGVNRGIRRFKEKWGGAPFLNYEFCECFYGTTRIVSLIRSIEGKL
jgi:hypothetical protein